MPTLTYTPLANITLGSSAASVTFSSISQAYRDLVVVIKYTSANTSYVTAFYKFNSDSTANAYQGVYAYGQPPYGQYSNTQSLAFGILNNGNSVDNTDTATILWNIQDYSVTDKHKSSLERSNMPGSVGTTVEMGALRWANTSAVNSIQIYTSNLFAAGSTFALYGVAA